MDVTCTCEERKANDEYPDCEVHVRCDDWCMALAQPETTRDFINAYEHWRSHPYLAGCSHAGR